MTETGQGFKGPVIVVKGISLFRKLKKVFRDAIRAPQLEPPETGLPDLVERDAEKPIVTMTEQTQEVLQPPIPAEARKGTEDPTSTTQRNTVQKQTPETYEILTRRVGSIATNDRYDVTQPLALADGTLSIKKEKIPVRDIETVAFVPSPNGDCNVDMLIRVRDANGRITEKYAGTFDVNSEAFKKTEQALRNAVAGVTRLFRLETSMPNLAP